MRYSIAVFFCLVFCLFGTYISLSNTKDVKYSCDDKIDKWIKANYFNLQNYTLDDILSHEAPYHKVIFSLLTPENKAKVFNQKLEYTVSQTWSQHQKEAILKFKSLVTEDFYKNKAKEKELIKWINDANNVFSDSELSYIAFTLSLNNRKEENDNIIPGPACECNKSFPNYSPCGPPFIPGLETTQCGDALCGVTLFACGPALGYKCDGMYFPVDVQ